MIAEDIGYHNPESATSKLRQTPRDKSSSPENKDHTLKSTTSTPSSPSSTNKRSPRPAPTTPRSGGEKINKKSGDISTSSPSRRQIFLEKRAKWTARLGLEDDKDDGLTIGNIIPAHRAFPMKKVEKVFGAVHHDLQHTLLCEIHLIY